MTTTTTETVLRCADCGREFDSHASANIHEDATDHVIRVLRAAPPSAPSGETGDSLDDAMLYLSSRIGGMEQTAADFASPYGQELCRALRTVLGAVASLRERVAEVQSLTNRLTTAQEAAWEYERQVDALTERAEARERDREDAARYRFLKPHLTIDDLGAGGDFDPAEYAIVLRDDAVMLKGIPLGGLDEAIDAARAPSTPSASTGEPT